MAKQGKLVRAYSYLGEQGEILLHQGQLTTIEKELRARLPEEEEWLPNEEDVITIANHWSISPATLGERSTRALGMIGTPSF